MKNKVLIILGLFIIVVGTVFFFKKNDKKESNASSLDLNIKETIDCTKDRNFYFDLKGSNYYLVCLDEVEIKVGKKSYSLKEALLNSKITIEEITNDLKETIDYNSGQATMYRDATLDLNNFVNISILKCDTEDGNKDYYIGNREMAYNNNYCRRVCSFTKTYYVNSINDIDDENMRLLIQNPKDDSYVEVNVKKISKKISPNSYIEFTFEKNSDQAVAQDTIENIFKTFKLIDLEITKKTGLSQTQEAICEIK